MPGSVGDFLMNLQAQRVAAGHSITRLAQLANISDREVIDIESGGNCNVDVAQRLADALGVSLGTLGAVSLE